MKNKEMNEAIRQAFTHATPNVLDSVLSDCREQKGTVIVMTEKKKISWGRKVAAMAAVLTLIIGIGLGVGSYLMSNTVSSTISLDVNPSIEIRVNRNERVLDVDALNQDAETVLDNMDLKGSDLNVAVNAIIGSMLRNGYITELANSILVSVDSKDAAAGAALQEKLAAEINKLLNTESFSGAVLSQTVTHEAAVENLAKEHSITLGKAQLIAEIVKQDSRYTFAELAALSINELNLIVESVQTPVENVTAMGTASDKSYIGAEAAGNAALAHAGLAEDQVKAMEVELDFDDGVMIYEVEFKSNGYDYDYDIDARTGTVLKNEKEPEDEIESGGQIIPPDGRIGEALALQTALQHAKLTEDQITDLKFEFDEDDGIRHYDVKFRANGYQYEYEIAAYSPTVLNAEKEADDDAPVNNAQTTPAAPKVIGKDAALAVALKHAGLTKEQITDLEIELDEDDGVDHYEIEFDSGGYDYQYEIHAQTGEVLKSEKDRND